METKKQATKSINKLSKTQFILLTFMLLTAVAIIGLGFFIVLRTIPSTSENINEADTSPAQISQSENTSRVIEFSISPEGQINLGECVQIKWQASGENNQLIIKRSSTIIFKLSNPGQTSAENIQDCPTQPGLIRYQITVTSPKGTDERELFIEVSEAPTHTPPIIELQTFSVQPEEIQIGDCVKINWSISILPNTLKLIRNEVIIFEEPLQEGIINDCPTSFGNITYSIISGGVNSRTITSTQSINVVKSTPIPEDSVLGIWQLAFYLTEETGYKEIISTNSISVTLAADGVLSGFAGCNTFTASYIKNDLDKTLEIKQVNLRDEICPSPPGIMQQEDIFIIRLLETNLYQVKNNLLEFFNQEGQKVLVFIREY